MGDEGKYQRTNSGRSACAVTKSGTRSKGVSASIAWARKHPGIDGATMGWLQMGGELVEEGGMYKIADADGFANFMFAARLATRAKEAVAYGDLVECSQRVVRSVKATGYRVAGGGQFPQPKPVERSIAGPNYASGADDGEQSNEVNGGRMLSSEETALKIKEMKSLLSDKESS